MQSSTLVLTSEPCTEIFLHVRLSRFMSAAEIELKVVSSFTIGLGAVFIPNFCYL